MISPDHSCFNCQFGHSYFDESGLLVNCDCKMPYKNIDQAIKETDEKLDKKEKK